MIQYQYENLIEIEYGIQYIFNIIVYNSNYNISHNNHNNGVPSNWSIGLFVCAVSIEYCSNSNIILFSIFRYYIIGTYMWMYM